MLAFRPRFDNESLFALSVEDSIKILFLVSFGHGIPSSYCNDASGRIVAYCNNTIKKKYEKVRNMVNNGKMSQIGSQIVRFAVEVLQEYTYTC